MLSTAMLPTAFSSVLNRCSNVKARAQWGRLGCSALGAIAALTLIRLEANAQAPTIIAQTGNPLISQMISQTATSGPYIVAVPGDNVTLRRVSRLYPNAFLDVARQGIFVNAGSFAGRESANSRASALRAEGLDARILYRAISIR